MTSRREHALRRRVRELWWDVLRERTDHVRARRLLRDLDKAKQDLRDERRKP